MTSMCAHPLRPFQASILEIARNQNVVMVGATGIGKTYVAIALLSEQDYSGGKRAFFMAPTRQLVWQITSKIQSSSTLRVRAYCGSEFDLWNQYQWQHELCYNRVFVCTPEIVRNLLEKGYVSMSSINLLVFDECHHVMKRHPYAQVIKHYHSSFPTRIFGTTACPTRNCAENLYAIMEQIDLEVEEEKEYAACAPVVYETYPITPHGENGLTTVDGEVVDGWEEVEMPINWLDQEQDVYRELLDELNELKVLAVLEKLLKKSNGKIAHCETSRKNALDRFVTMTATLYREYGRWCFYHYVELEVARCATNACKFVLVVGATSYWDIDAQQTFKMVQLRKQECGMVASLRVQKIESLLRSRFRNDKEEEVDPADVDMDESQPLSAKPLQGIVFVTTRIECRVLCDYLNAKLDVSSGLLTTSVEDDEDKNTRFSCILGQTTKSDTAAYNLPNMEKILTRFEAGKIQCLISTAVSIEGIDFPQCSIVIAVDRIDSARKLIQLRGRARHEDGVVYYLAQEGNLDHFTHYQILQHEAKAIEKLDFQYDKQESVLELPRSQAAAILESMEGVNSKGLCHFPDEFKVVVESTGAVLDLDSSITCLNQFLQTLSPQLYTVEFKTMYSFKQETFLKRPAFIATVQLPIEMEISPFISPRMVSKSTAKATAAFYACRYLLEHGHLDTALNSVYRKGKSQKLEQLHHLNYFRTQLLRS